MKKLKNWFSKMGYPEKFISEQVNRALISEENGKEQDGQHIKKCCPLVVTHNPNFKKLSFLIRKNIQFLYVHRETKRVFMPAPFVFFQSARNLKSFLVRT